MRNNPVEIKKASRTAAIYPTYFALSVDLLVWAVINVLFLTTVKGFSAGDVASCMTIATLTSIVSYSLVLKVIKRFGDAIAMRCGTVFMLIAMLIVTFGVGYPIILVGHIFYEIGLLLKTTENVLLERNLLYLDRHDEYINKQNQGTFLCSILTLIVALSSGVLFNLWNYLPCVIGIVVCAIAAVLSFIMTSPANMIVYADKTIAFSPIKAEQLSRKRAVSIHPRDIAKSFKRFGKIALLAIAVFGLMFAVIDNGQINSNLALQYKMEDFLSPEMVALVLSVSLTVSRVCRVLGNIVYMRVCDRIANKLPFVVLCSVIGACLVTVVGHFCPDWMGVILMTIGFSTFFFVRDPILNYLKTVIIDNVTPRLQEKAMVYLILARKVSKVIIGFAITMILMAVDVMFVMLFLAACGAALIPVVMKLKKKLVAKEMMEMEGSMKPVSFDDVVKHGLREVDGPAVVGETMEEIKADVAAAVYGDAAFQKEKPEYESVGLGDGMRELLTQDDVVADLAENMEFTLADETSSEAMGRPEPEIPVS